MITVGQSCPRYYPTPSPLPRRHTARHDYAEALGLDATRLTRCVSAQEVLLVFWLVRMATHGTAGAAVEARHRAATLDQTDARWEHLR